MSLRGGIEQINVAENRLISLKTDYKHQ